jgi:hypothetical protein
MHRWMWAAPARRSARSSRTKLTDVLHTLQVGADVLHTLQVGDLGRHQVGHCCVGGVSACARHTNEIAKRAYHREQSSLASTRLGRCRLWGKTRSIGGGGEPRVRWRATPPSALKQERRRSVWPNRTLPGARANRTSSLPLGRSSAIGPPALSAATCHFLHTLTRTRTTAHATAHAHA